MSTLLKAGTKAFSSSASSASIALKTALNTANLSFGTISHEGFVGQRRLRLIVGTKTMVGSYAKLKSVDLACFN